MDRPTTLDGFIARSSISFLSDSTELNEWSHGKQVAIEVHDFYLCMHPFKIVWKGKTYTVPDYEMFLATIQQWMKNGYGLFSKPRPRDEVLEEYFSITDWIEEHPNVA